MAIHCDKHPPSKLLELFLTGHWGTQNKPHWHGLWSHYRHREQSRDSGKKCFPISIPPCSSPIKAHSVVNFSVRHLFKIRPPFAVLASCRFAIVEIRALTFDQMSQLWRAGLVSQKLEKAIRCNWIPGPLREGILARPDMRNARLVLIKSRKKTGQTLCRKRKMSKGIGYSTK